MARSLKPQLVKTIVHREIRTLTIDIFLDRNALDFFFDADSSLDGRVRAGSVDELVPLAREHLAKLAVVEWEPVISVGHDTDYGQRSYCNNAKREDADPERCDLRLNFERFERGKFDGKWALRRDHPLDVDPDDHRQRRSDSYHDIGRVIIPYTDAAWSALLAIVEGVHDLNAKLEELLKDETTATHFLTRMSKKLPPMLPPYVVAEDVGPDEPKKRGRRIPRSR